MLSLAMLQLAPNLKVQLVQYDKPADRGKAMPRNCDLGGHHVALLVANTAFGGTFTSRLMQVLREPSVRRMRVVGDPVES